MVFPSKTKSLDEILVEDSSYDCTSSLKKRLFKEGVKEQKCECCGISEWLGKPIALELHHINGVHNDNRIENLQILCPNCHSQTNNYCGKNAKKHTQKLLTNKEKEEISKKLYGKIFHNDKKPKIEKYCLYCGKIIENCRSKSKYCSTECAHKAQQKLPSDDIMFQLIRNKSNNEIAAELNVSEGCIRNWKKKHL